MRDTLRVRRSQGFVGRADELALFRGLLADPDSGAVLFLSGPGGIGKSTLLLQYESLGEEAGRHVVRLDGRDVAPVPSTFLSALANAAGVSEATDPLEALAETPGVLLLIDTAELLVPLDRWWREELLPALGAGALTVVAGREPPTVAWRTDPGWRGLLHSVGLGALPADQSRALLEVHGVPAERQAEALAFAGGHPLALSLVADVVAQGGQRFEPTAAPEVVGALLGCLIETVPSLLHRRALEACAQVLTTTEDLLAVLLEVDDAHDLFAWLRSLSVVETGPRGLYPHDVARDALGAELRWRHPEQYAEIHRRAGAYYRARFYTVPTDEQQQLLVEYVFLHRDNPVLGPFVTGTAGSGVDLRSFVATPAAEEERSLARAIVERHEGPEAGALLDLWFTREPGSVSLVRGPDGDVLGVVTTVALHMTTLEDRSADPAVGRVAAYLDSLPPLAPGEVAVFFRFWMQREEYQDLGPVQMFITLHFVRYYMSTPGLAYSFVYYADPDRWADICAYADVARLPAADFTLGGRHYGVYWHDWRRTPPMAWLQQLGDREISRRPLDPPTALLPGHGDPVERLSEAHFAAAVKDALRSYAHADGLRASPLLDADLVTSRLTADADVGARVRVLRERIDDAAARMQASPRDRRAFRALHHTYLQPARTQADAAELLDLPMSTYRRHLATGVSRLTAILLADDLDSEPRPRPLTK
jgi:hypothetical protein